MKTHFANSGAVRLTEVEFLLFFFDVYFYTYKLRYKRKLIAGPGESCLVPRQRTQYLVGRGNDWVARPKGNKRTTNKD